MHSTRGYLAISAPYALFQLDKRCGREEQGCVGWMIVFCDAFFDVGIGFLGRGTLRGCLVQECVVHHAMTGLGKRSVRQSCIENARAGNALEISDTRGGRTTEACRLNRLHIESTTFIFKLQALQASKEKDTRAEEDATRAFYQILRSNRSNLTSRQVF